MYSHPRLIKHYVRPKGCDMPNCKHHISNYTGTCNCSSKEEKITGGPDCPGFRENPYYTERKVRK